MKSFAVSPGWRVILVDLGLRPADILRRARLPGDLFARSDAALTTTEYFALWEAIDDEANEPALPIRLGEALRAEVFDPAIFAAMWVVLMPGAAQRSSTRSPGLGSRISTISWDAPSCCTHQPSR